MPRMKRFALASGLILALCSFGFRPLSAFAQAEDEAAIQSLIEKFFANYQKEDIKGLMLLWSENSPSLAMDQRRFQETFEGLQNIEVSKLIISRVTIAADRAKVQLSIEVSALDTETGKPADGLGKVSRIFRLVKAGAGWKIWRYATSIEDLAAALTASQTEEERRTLLEEAKGLSSPELVTELVKQGRALYGRGDLEKVLRVAEITLNIAEKDGDRARCNDFGDRLFACFGIDPVLSFGHCGFHRPRPLSSSRVQELAQGVAGGWEAARVFFCAV